MKKIYLLFAALFSIHALFSQILYKEGIVKGKNVTYEVIRGKGYSAAHTFIRNVNNPDTTFPEVPNHGIPPQLTDIGMQVAEIIHNHLLPEELAELAELAKPQDDAASWIFVTFRMDAKNKKLLQISSFSYLFKDRFWANFPPDRLFELEQAILNKVELPDKLQKTFFEADFLVGAHAGDILNIEKTRKTRKEAIKDWKRHNYEVGRGPKYILH